MTLSDAAYQATSAAVELGIKWGSAGLVKTRIKDSTSAGVLAVSARVIASGFWALKRVLEILDDDVNDV